MDLSVIIACYNAEDTIREQLHALEGQYWPGEWEVIIVNNRSSDSSMSVVKTFYGKIQNLLIVDALEKQGQPYALNVGVQASRGKTIAFCDADDVICEGWIASMGTALKSLDFVSGPFEIDKLNDPIIKYSRRNPQSTGIQQYTYPAYLPHAGSGNMGVNRKIFDSVCGFNESMPILFDTDFCWRVQLNDVKLNVVPSAILHIRYRVEVSKIIKQARLYGEYNVLLYKKFRPLGMPKLSFKEGLMKWKMLFKRWRHLRNSKLRIKWLRQFGWLLGRLYGCIKYRTIAL